MLAWRQSPLLRNVLAVATGTLGGQVIVFAFSPLITRIYSPETFGLQGIFLSLISVLSPLVALRYPMAIVVAKDDHDARQLARLSLLIALCISILLGLILLVAQHQMLWLLGAEALGPLIWFLPLALFCVALQDTASFSASRLSAFRLVGITTMAQAFISNLARVLGGLVTPTATILVAVTALAPAIQSTMLRLGMRKHLPVAPPLQREEALGLLKTHRDFPTYRTPTDMLNAASQAVPVILLTALYSPAEAGLYVLARSVINLPVSIIAGSMGSPFYSHLAQMQRDGLPLLPLALRSTLILLVPGAATLLAAIFFPAAFALIFGGEWRPAGEYAQWLALWAVGMLANIPTTRALPVIGRQAAHLVFNVLISIGGVVGFGAAYYSGQGSLVAIASFSAALALMYATQISTYLLLIRRHDRRTALV